MNKTLVGKRGVNHIEAGAHPRFICGILDVVCRDGLVFETVQRSSYFRLSPPRSRNDCRQKRVERGQRPRSPHSSHYSTTTSSRSTVQPFAALSPDRDLGQTHQFRIHPLGELREYVLELLVVAGEFFLLRRAPRAYSPVPPGFTPLLGHRVLGGNPELRAP